jgi:TP901-1 family phage major tail protein
MAIAGAKVTVKLYNGVTGTILGGQRGATLNRSAETMDSTNKDSNGWSESVPGVKSWGIDCDGVFVDNDAAYETLEAAFLAGTTVKVGITFPSGTVFVGQAVIADMPLEFPFDDLSTYSLTLTGTGALGAAV